MQALEACAASEGGKEALAHAVKIFLGWNANFSGGPRKRLSHSPKTVNALSVKSCRPRGSRRRMWAPDRSWHPADSAGCPRCRSKRRVGHSLTSAGARKKLTPRHKTAPAGGDMILVSCRQAVCPSPGSSANTALWGVQPYKVAVHHQGVPS